jgi:hypothetical protein
MGAEHKQLNEIVDVDEKHKETDINKQDDIVKEDLHEDDSIDYENDPEYKDIPLVVRELVTFEDDPEVPSLTFR